MLSTVLAGAVVARHESDSDDCATCWLEWLSPVASETYTVDF